MPRNVDASATAKVTRSDTPASAAALRAASIDSVWLSIPTTSQAGKALAIMTELLPWPQPTSSTRPPACSFASTPPRAGIHCGISEAAYNGSKNRAHPVKRCGSCSCQPTPSPERNASAARSSAAHWAIEISNPPMSEAGDWSSASTAACSAGSSKRPDTGS